MFGSFTLLVRHDGLTEGRHAHAWELGGKLGAGGPGAGGVEIVGKIGDTSAGAAGAGGEGTGTGGGE